MPTIRPDLVVRPAALARASTARLRAYDGRRAHRPLQPGHRLDVVVEHVGPGGEDRRRATPGRPCSRRSAPRPACPGVRRRMASMVAAKPAGAAVGQVVAGDGGDHGVAPGPSASTASATRSGSAGSSGRGWRVSTRQKPQARVQRSPLIMNVAVPSAQHSKMLGQPASSHTVTRSRSRMVRLSSQVLGPDAAPWPAATRACARAMAEPSVDARPRRAGPSSRTEVPRPGPAARPRRRSPGPSPRVNGGQVRRAVAPDDVGAVDGRRAPHRAAAAGDDGVDDLGASMASTPSAAQRRDRLVGDAARDDVAEHAPGRGRR